MRNSLEQEIGVEVETGTLNNLQDKGIQSLEILIFYYLFFRNKKKGSPRRNFESRKLY